MQRTILCATSVAFVIIVSSLTAEANSRYSYVVEATNRMLALNAMSGRATSVEAAATAVQACDALGILLEDQQFARDLRRWEENQFSEERSAFARDLGLFIDAFLVPERAVLDYAGLDENAQDRVLMAAATTQASVDIEIVSAQVLSGIKAFRGQVCGVAARIGDVVRQEELVQELRRLATGMAGVVLIVADLPFAGTGPGAVVAALSGAAGTNLLSRLLPR